MKTIVLILIIIVLVVGLGGLFGQEVRPRTPGNPVYLSWVTARPVPSPRGDPLTFIIGAEYSQLELSVSGEAKRTVVARIEFDLLKGSDEDRKLAEMIEQRTMLEYRTTFPPPLPDARPALRAPAAVAPAAKK